MTEARLLSANGADLGHRRASVADACNGHTRRVNIPILLIVILIALAASYAFWVAMQTTTLSF
jgi:hypothetical protein